MDIMLPFINTPLLRYKIHFHKYFCILKFAPYPTFFRSIYLYLKLYRAH